MHTLYRLILPVHIAFGFFGLVAFWFPVLSPKGGTLHVRAGKVFLLSAYIVAGTAITVALLTIAQPFATHPDRLPSNPADIPATLADLRQFSAFLAYLGIITLASVFHGVRAMQTKKDPAAIRTPFHTAINLLAMAAGAGILVMGILVRQPIFLALAPIGLLIGWGGLRYARRPPRTRRAYFYEHMGGMLGAGIAFHTAFAVFGIQRFVEFSLEGPLEIVPWVLPAIIGVPANYIWTRRYRRKFGEIGAPEVA
ncbi:MAG: hypothetical protein ABR559_02535 [Gemmatimonadota bacterium]